MTDFNMNHDDTLKYMIASELSTLDVINALDVDHETLVLIRKIHEAGNTRVQ